MKVVVIGATGTIGRAVVAALKGTHDVVAVSRTKSPITCDIANPDSIRAMYATVGRADAVVVAAGDAVFKELAALTDADFQTGLRSKFMGQVNAVRLGFDSVSDGGSFTLTSGVLASKPAVGSAAISPVNAAVEGFGRAAALEAPRGIRVNVVSPGWVSETLQAMGRDPSRGTPAAAVAKAYIRSVEGQESGAVIDASGGA